MISVTLAELSDLVEKRSPHPIDRVAGDTCRDSLRIVGRSAPPPPSKKTNAGGIGRLELRAKERPGKKKTWR